MTKVNFRTNILLKNIIGKDLITDDNVAVLELVKNSFDSGSNVADLIFEDVITHQPIKEYKNANNSKFILQDTGSGMSEYDLVNKWLNIAYSEKKSKKHEFNRNLAGNKGVGRFSCDRLGKTLIIYTKKINEPLIKLSIDWTKFEKIDDIKKNIQDIFFELEVISSEQFIEETGLKRFKSGTTLFISNLRDVWDFEKIKSLRRQLERFINPNQNFESEPFDITIHANEFKKLELGLPEAEKINGIIKNRIFSELNFKATYITSIISHDGKLITTKLTDQGNEIFTLVENNPYDLLKNMEINIYYLNPYSKAYFKRQTGIRSVDFGSIFLFINGFRIPPYGDQGNDWLGMEIRKGQGYNRFLGTREVIGRIEINGVEFDDENDDFFIISNRSGVDNNKHYEQLTKNDSPYGFYFKTFRRLERFVVEGIKWDSSKIPESEIEKKVLDDKKWNETKEEFKEDNLTRNKRVISIIEKIINVKADDIISLSINKTIVTELAEQQAQKVKAEIDSIVGQLTNKALSSDQISQIIAELNISKKDIEGFPVKEEGLEELLIEQEKLRSQLQEKYEETKILEEETKKLQDELELEKQKNTYLLTSKRTLSEDAKGLIHNVKQTSKKSKQNAENLYNAFLENNVKKNTALKNLSTIIYNSDKALKISNLITRANFKANADYQDVNIIKFTEQYLDLYNVMFEDNNISFSIKNNIEAFWKRISILDISLVLDDLISNSIKAKAENVKITTFLDEHENLVIHFSDDGIGLADNFLSKPDVIFDLGVTTTDGSGIGLNYVKNTLSKMQGKINFMGNNIILKGASFELKISKAYN